MDTFQNLALGIINGDFDEDLDRIRDAIRTREKALLSTKAFSFRVKDRVRFNDHARPKYLVGIEGVVEKVNQSSLVVRIGKEGGRYANSAPRCPLAIVDKIEA